MPRFGLPGEQIGYRVYPGPEGAPPLLLIHGFTASSASFVTNIVPLSQEFTVVTVDLLGHGESDAPEQPAPYGPEPAVQRIVGLIEHLGYERAMLCGHSLGGALALRVALDAPERVAAVVVINSNSAAGTPEWRARATEGLRQMAERVRAEGTGFLQRSRLYPAASTRLPDDARALLVRDFDALKPQGVAGTAEALTVQVNAFERLPDLSVPALVVIGDRDRDFVGNSVAFLDQMPPDLTSWITLEDAGHAANLEQPEQFEQALIEYADELGYLNVSPSPAASSSTRSTVLTVAGLAMITAGIVMVVGAFIIDRDGGRQPVTLPLSAGPDVTATPTPVEASAGIRTPGAEAASPTTSTSQAAPSPPVADTPAPTGTPVPQPTATTAQPAGSDPTATATEEPTEEPTATETPSAPFAAIVGPGTAAVGDTGLFQSASSPGFLRQRWDGCAPGLNEASCSLFFDTSGCFQVTLTVFYPNEPQPFVDVHQVAVGDATCQ